MLCTSLFLCSGVTRPVPGLPLAWQLHLFSAGREREGGAQASPFSEPLCRQVEQIPSYTITRTRKFASLSVLFASLHGQILQEHPVSTKSTQPPYSSSEISNSPPPPRADVICGSPRRNAPPVRVSLPSYCQAN